MSKFKCHTNHRIRDIVVPKQKASERIAGKDVADGNEKRRHCLHPTWFQSQNLSLLRHRRDALHHTFWSARTALSKHIQNEVAFKP